MMHGPINISFTATSQALEVVLCSEPNKARNVSVCAVCELCSSDTVQLISCSDSCEIRLQSSRLALQAVDYLKRNNGCEKANVRTCDSVTTLMGLRDVC